VEINPTKACYYLLATLRFQHYTGGNIGLGVIHVEEYSGDYPKVSLRRSISVNTAYESFKSSGTYENCHFTHGHSILMPG
jgi:hypothetical protein